MNALIVTKLRQLLVLLITLSTLLFFLLRLAGDPALVLAGLDASPEQLVAIRAEYGLNRPLILQYFTHLTQVIQLDFGTSLASGAPALDLVLKALPPTLLLTTIAMIVTLAVSIPLGTWIGGHPGGADKRVVNAVIFILQGTPGFVAGLLLIQLFAVSLKWLPSLGYGGINTWILPTLTLASFLVPKLTRVIAANVAEAMGEDYVRTARAIGASRLEVLQRHVLPNALLGATALIGTQVAFLISGSVITETLFAWPGIGLLLIQSTQNLDFPVVQLLVFVIAILVFLVNAFTDFLITRFDPRLRAPAP